MEYRVAISGRIGRNYARCLPERGRRNVASTSPGPSLTFQVRKDGPVAEGPRSPPERHSGLSTYARSCVPKR
jgi:hypothetical protein